MFLNWIQFNWLNERESILMKGALWSVQICKRIHDFTTFTYYSLLKWRMNDISLNIHSYSHLHTLMSWFQCSLMHFTSKAVSFSGESFHRKWHVRIFDQLYFENQRKNEWILIDDTWDERIVLCLECTRIVVIIRFH